MSGEISSLVIDTLRKQTCGENMVVLSLYCDYQTQKDQSVVNIIGSLLSQVALGRVYICFDAMDELLPQNRSELLRTLQQIIRDAPNIRLFLTGRPYIRGELDKYLTKRAYIIHIVADQGDIARYVSRKMEDDEDDGGPDFMPDDLKHDILKTMVERASEM